MTATVTEDLVGTLQRIPLEELHESPLNPRKHYDPEALQQLANNIAEVGQITPVTVRPRPAGGYELLAGHRRARAAKLAGLSSLEAKVREDLDDKQAIEILNIENLQRDDLHALEEAQGFKTLMTEAGYDVTRIAARVGRSVKYVYDRLKLLQLIPAAQKMFLASEFEAGHAIILARLSDKDQKRALDEKSYRGGLFEHEDTGDLGIRDARKPVSVREFQHWVNDHVRFDPAAEDLPNLFPETATVLADASEQHLEIVSISRDPHYGEPEKAQADILFAGKWKRADGKAETDYRGQKTPGRSCDHSVMGVVALGPGRGEAFRVCITRKCKSHWQKEQREAAQAPRVDQAAAAERHRKQQENWQRQEEQRKAEQARLRKARPAILKVVAEHIAKLPAGARSALGKGLLENLGREDKEIRGLVAVGTSAEELVRYLAWRALAEDLSSDWGFDSTAKDCKALGIDIRAILDREAPKEKAEIKKPGKKLAGDVRRAKNAKKRKAA